MKFRQLLWLAVVLAVAAGFWYKQRPQTTPVLQRASAGKTVDENHFSPEENLEQLDVAQIDSARRSLDIAMFAFTDKYISDAVLRAAQRGVKVRLYRDHQQFQDEQRRAGEHNDQSTAGMFRGEPNVQIRVKHNRELMHLKAYCVDGALLRDGSANWSPSGLKRQDNNARLTTSPAEIERFQQVFEQMWSQRNNDEF
jgi:phosphatidylserine/phosphatidylglycerophosphate/cardiolipin synthase-like enzyme